MVFSHIGRRHEYNGFANEAELADGACSGTAYHEVGSLVCGSHVAYEVHHLEHWQLVVVLQLLGNRGAIVLACLPYKLHAALLYEVEMLQHALVNGSCSEASAN